MFKELKETRILEVKCDDNVTSINVINEEINGEIAVMKKPNGNSGVEKCNN